MQYPLIAVDSTRADLRLDSADNEIRTLDMEMVLDMDRFGGICGIEILDLMHTAGAKCLELMCRFFGDTASEGRFSFDPDVDAFYFRLSCERSLDQEAVDGQVALNRLGQIIRISCSRQGPQSAFCQGGSTVQKDRRVTRSDG